MDRNKMIMSTCYFISLIKRLWRLQMKLSKNMVWVDNIIAFIFINKLPGITIKQLLNTLEISKQGSHATLKKLKEEALIIEQQSEEDRRVKQLFPTPKGSKLVEKLNKAQDELMQQTFQKLEKIGMRLWKNYRIIEKGFKILNI